MATRSAILTKVGDKYIGVYCHSASYSTLKKHYNTQAAVEALIKLGELSEIGPLLAPKNGQAHSFKYPANNVTIAYYRDSSETRESQEAPEIHSGESINETVSKIDHEIVYVFENGCWRAIEEYDPMDDYDETLDSAVDKHLKKGDELTKEQMNHIHSTVINKVQKKCIKKGAENSLEYSLDLAEAEKRKNNAFKHIKDRQESDRLKKIAQAEANSPRMLKISEMCSKVTLNTMRANNFNPLCAEERARIWKECEAAVDAGEN